MRSVDSVAAHGPRWEKARMDIIYITHCVSKRVILTTQSLQVSRHPPEMACSFSVLRHKKVRTVD